MKVAVITPYYKESVEKLRRCMDSVRDQTHSCIHIMVSDGHPAEFVDIRKTKDLEPEGQETIQHLLLPVAHGDYGDTPRFIGTVSAYSQGFDAVCWLDADNWIEPTHVESLLELAHRKVVNVVTATRNLYRPDGSFLDICNESDGESFNDTNCYLLMREAMAVACRWGFKSKSISAVGDRVVFDSVKTLFPKRAHNVTPTVNYESYVAAHYIQRGETPPREARVIHSRDGGMPFISESYWDLVGPK